jgi:hypothetical protein
MNLEERHKGSHFYAAVGSNITHEIRDGIYYFSDGEITDTKTNGFWHVPAMSFPIAEPPESEWFSKWNDEKRRQVREKEIAASYEVRDKLVESAREKLTEEEFNAVLSEGRD